MSINVELDGQEAAMAQEKGYQGWANYETWAVKLWIDNEEPSYHYWQEAADAAWEEAEKDKYASKEDNAIRALADRLKDEHEEAMPLIEGVWSDLLTSALGEVDWFEIASAMIEEAKERVGAEE